MANARAAQRARFAFGATRKQALVIVLLCIALATVLSMQFFSSTPPTAEQPAELAEDAARPPRPATKAAAPRTRVWPVLPLEDVLAHDPFALSTAAQREIASQEPPPAPPEETNEVLAALQEAGVSAIVRDAKGAVAVVGSRMLRLGDLVEGFRVVAIGADGVTLESEPETKP